jgi:hypothetical protein
MAMARGICCNQQECRFCEQDWHSRCLFDRGIAFHKGWDCGFVKGCKKMQPVSSLLLWGKGCHPFPTSPWDEMVLRVRSWAGQVLRGNHLYIWWRILQTEKEWAKKSGWTISGDQKSPVGTFNVCTRILGLSFFLKPHPAVASLNKCLRHLFPTFANTKNNQWCWASKMFKLISLHRQKLVGQMSYPSSNDEAILQRI